MPRMYSTQPRDTSLLLALAHRVTCRHTLDLRIGLDPGRELAYSKGPQASGRRTVTIHSPSVCQRTAKARSRLALRLAPHGPTMS